jgi:hypothetical protein
MADTPFVGPTYPLRSLPASVQRTINMSPVQIETGNERVRWVFKDTPGLVDIDPTRPPTYYTSWPYPLFAFETFDVPSAVPMAGQLWLPPHETFETVAAVPLSGTINTVLQTYDAPAEELETLPAEPLSGTLNTVLEVYDAPAQELETLPAVPLSGTLVVQLITYSNWPADELETFPAVPLSGTLV